MRQKGLLKANSFGKKRNFLASSKAKTGEGFRILMNWSSNSCTMRSFIGAVLGFCTIVILLVYDQTKSLQNGHVVGSGCDCFNRDAEPIRNTSSFGATQTNTGTAIVYFPKPERSFHGNHWFHIGEHYISRRGAVQQMLAQYQHQGSSVEHLRIIVQDPKLANMMTKMSFSLIVMTFLSAMEGQHVGPLQTIELFKETDVETTVAEYRGEKMVTVDKVVASQRAKFIAKKDPLFGYYKENTVDNMIVEYRSKSGNKAAATPVFTLGAPSAVQDSREVVQQPQLKCRKQPSATLEDMYRRFTEPLFVESAPHPAPGCTSEVCSCGVYIGELRHTPIPSFEWFHSYLDADQLRSTALAMCGIPERVHSVSGPASSKLAVSQPSQVPQKLTLLIYQRDLNRRFVHLHGIKRALQERSSLLSTSNSAKHEWDIRVMKHNEDAAPCDLFKALHSADILLTAHGFQSTGMLFFVLSIVVLVEVCILHSGDVYCVILPCLIFFLVSLCHIQR